MIQNQYWYWNGCIIDALHPNNDYIWLRRNYIYNCTCRRMFLFMCSSIFFPFKNMVISFFVNDSAMQIWSHLRLTLNGKLLPINECIPSTFMPKYNKIYIRLRADIRCQKIHRWWNNFIFKQVAQKIVVYDHNLIDV